MSALPASRSAALAAGGALLLVLLCTVYAGRLGYAPDEPSHVGMVAHHAHHLRLATRETFPYGEERAHAYQLFSPVPYALHVPFYRLAESLGARFERGIGDRLPMRLGGSAYVLLLLLVAQRVARQLFGPGRGATLAALAATLHPMIVYVHGYVNADAFALLAASLAFLVTLRLVDAAALDLRLTALAGAALALLAHAKYPAFPAAVPLVAAWVWRLRATPLPILPRLRHAGLLVAIPLALAGWFHLATFRELGNGHLLAGADHLALLHATYHGAPQASTSDGLVLRRLHDLPFLFTSYWGWLMLFGELPLAYQALLGLSVSAGAAGVVVGLTRSRGPHPARHTGWLLASGPGVTLASYLALAAQPNLEIQGRLLLPHFLPCMLLLVAGWAVLLRRAGLAEPRALEVAAAGFGALMLLGSAILLATGWPRLV